MPDPLIHFFPDGIVDGLRSWESILEPCPSDGPLEALVVAFVNRAWPSLGARAIRQRARNWARMLAQPNPRANRREEREEERTIWGERSEPDGMRWALRCLHRVYGNGDIRTWDTEIAVAASDAPAALLTVRLRARHNEVPMPHVPRFANQLVGSVGLIDGAVRLAEANHHIVSAGHVEEFLRLTTGFRLSPVILVSVEENSLMNPWLSSPQTFYRYNRGVMHLFTIGERFRRVYNDRVPRGTRLEKGGIQLFDPGPDSQHTEPGGVQARPLRLEDDPRDPSERSTRTLRMLRDEVFRSSLNAYRFRWALPRLPIEPPVAQ